MRSFPMVARFLSVCAMVLALTPGARGDDDDDHDEITRVINLTRSEAAPENARGRAELEIGHRGDAGSKRIEVDTSGLANGTYTVTVFEQSTGLGTVLGTFRVGDDDDEDDDDGDDDGEDNSRRGDDDDDEGEGEFNIPDSVNEFDLGAIVISDEGGTEMLTGDFTDTASTHNGRSHLRTPVIPGELAPDASGRAEVKGHIRRGKSNGQFRIEARGLPPRTAVVLNVDGNNAGTARTDRRGRLRIRKSARELNVFSISTVSLRAESGGELASAQF